MLLILTTAVAATVAAFGGVDVEEVSVRITPLQLLLLLLEVVVAVGPILLQVAARRASGEGVGLFSCNVKEEEVWVWLL